MSHHVEIASPDEAAELIKRLGLSDGQPVPGLAARLKGHVTITCREENGDEAWKVSQPNLVTDTGLRRLAFGWHNSGRPGAFHFFLSPNTELPVPNRNVIADHSAQTIATFAGNGSSFANASGNGKAIWFDSATLTWTYGWIFDAGTARKIGTVGMGVHPGGSTVINTGFKDVGMVGVCAYTVLNPPKVQNANQTVELVYRITLVPVF